MAWLASAARTYPEPGATRAALPDGYPHISREVLLAHGRGAFDEATDALFTWQMHRAAGVSVTSSHPVAEPGAVVVLRVGLGPASLTAPCRVVYRVAEPEGGEERDEGRPL